MKHPPRPRNPAARPGGPLRRLRGLGQSVRTGFWAIPALCVLVAIALAHVLVQLDHTVKDVFGLVSFGGGADGAREVLSAITTSMITFTGLVFSITIVVLQLTSSQFSPRVLRTFLRDRQTQLSLGVFVATFVYAVLVLRTVSSVEGETFVPSVATAFGVGLLLLSVGVFVAYIHHIATAIQVSSIIRSIGRETRETIDRRFPATPISPPGPPTPPGRVLDVVPTPGFGVVTTVDAAALVAVAADAGVVLRMSLHIGDFVPEGAPLLEVHAADHQAPDLDLASVQAAVHLAKDRTMQQDVAFGFRQLVDIAERALSPGINDPTTAVQTLDELHDLLRRLAARPLPNGVHIDDTGAARLVLPPDRFCDYLALALDEIDQYGADAGPVQSRIDALLADLADAALPQHVDDVRARIKQRREPQRTG